MVKTTVLVLLSALVTPVAALAADPFAEVAPEGGGRALAAAPGVLRTLDLEGVPVAFAAQTLRVTATTTSLREQAAADAAIVVGLPQGTELDVIGQQGSWYLVRVRASGAEGFVHSLAVQTISGSAVPAVPPPAQGQYPGAPSTGASGIQSGFTRREPIVSLILSMVYPGLGQFYNGPTQHRKAAIHAGVATGALVLAFATTGDCAYGECGGMALGLLGYMGMSVYSLVDAAMTAGELNRQHGFAFNVKPERFGGEVGMQASASYSIGF